MLVNSSLIQLERLLRKNNLVKAKKLALQLYKSSPNNEQVLKSCVLVFVKTKELKRAVYFADKLLSKDPANFGYVTNLANWCLALGKTQRAAEYYQGYVSSYPGNARAYFQLGLIYKLNYQYELSVQMFESAISSGYVPLEECYINLAITHEEFRQESVAISCLEQALEINPRHQIARLNLATLLQAAGNKIESEKLYEEILSQEPAFIEALVRLIYSKKSRPDDLGLIEMAKNQLASQASSVYDKESLNYALGKAHDDLRSYSQAFDYYRVANKFQARRIGAYKSSEMALYVDQCINGITAEWVNKSDSNSQMEPIFIVGNFRSGSTLVEQILAGHSAIDSLGEVGYFIRMFHEQGELLSSLYTSAKPELLQELANQYEELTATMSTGPLRITDKRPDNILLMALIKRLFPKAKFIHTQRNLLDNAVSVYFQQLGASSKYATSLVDVADYDSQCQKLMRHWQSIFGACIFELSYESLVNDPEAHARALIDFLGLEWEPGCLDFTQRQNFVRTASVSQVREKIYTSSVGRGQNYLDLLTAEEKDVYTPISR